MTRNQECQKQVGQLRTDVEIIKRDLKEVSRQIQRSEDAQKEIINILRRLERKNTGFD